jgi:hypothetical protein
MSLFTLSAAPCVNGDTLAQYVSMYATAGCTYGGFTFSDFTYTDSASGAGGSLVTARDVYVYTAINADGSGLSFEASWDADGYGSTSDGDVAFNVTVDSGAESITDAGLAQTGGVAGSGIATVSEQGCGPIPCVPGTWQVLTFDAGTGPGEDQSSADTLLTSTGSVRVSKDINANAGTGDGFDEATITKVTDVFSTVPEPRALSLLLGLGLVAGFVFRKKFQGARA